MAQPGKMQWFPTEFAGVRYHHGFYKKDGAEYIKKNGVRPDKYFRYTVATRLA